MHALEWFCEFFVLHFVEFAEFSACMHNTKVMMMGIIFICISTPLDFENFFFGYTKSAHLLDVCLNFQTS
jgi:hypothetical protein